MQKKKPSDASHFQCSGSTWAHVKRSARKVPIENKIISFVRLFLARLPKLNVAVGTCNIIRSHRVVKLNLAQQWRLPRSVTSLKTKVFIWILDILVWEQYRVGKQHYFLQRGRGLDVCKYLSGDKWISSRIKPHSNNTQRWRKLENRGEIQSYS